jgi:uncharacterized membrane protein
MRGTFKSKTRIFQIVFLVLFLLFILVGSTWFFYFIISAPSFSKDTAVTIHDSIIQGISGLGSVAIAVIIFRIQSLENRNESLEQTTLNYISQTMGWSYPEWTASLEDDIKNKTITNRYFGHVPSGTDEFIAAEKDRHQKRLEEALELHTRTQQTIHRIRSYVFSCVFFLIVPILLSLLLLMVTALLDLFWNFVFLSVVILMCALGILLLIQMVVESTVTES